MGWYGPLGDCGCCIPAPSCDVFDDDFNRSNSTNLGSDWTEVSGDWEIASNVLTIDEIGVVVCDEVHPDSETTQIVTVDVKVDTSNSAVAIILDYDDSNNYHYAKLSLIDPDNGDPAGIIQLFKVTGGTPAQLGSDYEGINAESGQWYSLRACMTDTSITCTFGGKTYGEATTAHGGYQTGLLASPDSSGDSSYFDDFVFTKRYSSSNTLCATCDDCEDCKSGLTPGLVKAVIAGVADDNCSDCDLWDGTYIVPRNNGVQQIGSDCEWWMGSISSAMSCPHGSPDAEISIAGYALGYKTSVKFRITGVMSCWSWFIDTDNALPDCVDWDTTDIPYNSQTQYCCDFSSATCKLTAL